MQYSFTCVPPRGFVITSEETGPGQVMTLVKRSQTSAEEPNIALRVYPLKGATLQRFFDRRVLGGLEQAEGVSSLDSRPLSLGGREGLEATLRRTYASGEVFMRIFCFQYGNDAYLVEYSDPDADSPKGAPALEDFVRSLAFR